MQRLTTVASSEAYTAWGLLSAISNPEVPVLTTTDLDMVRSAERCSDGWVIGSTPTYFGYPATEHLLGEIHMVMTEYGYTSIHVILQLDPPWTTDWTSPGVCERLYQYGISPLQAYAYHVEMLADAQCSRCVSIHTSLISESEFCPLYTSLSPRDQASYPR